MTDDSTDRNLLAAATKGNQEAFLRLFRRYRTPVFRFLYRLLGSEKTAEDITHDAFLELIRNPNESIVNETSLIIQLYATARKFVIENEQAHVENNAARLEEESVKVIRRSINDLPPFEREIIILFLYEDSR